MKNLVLCLLAGFLFLIAACEKFPKDPIEPYKGRNYFPTKIGHELVYNVEKITINTATDLFDTAHYQVKEVITGNFTDNDGRASQYFDRYIKDDTTGGNFELYKTWSSCVLTSTALRVEDNIKYIKLAFPMQVNQIWNSSSLNLFGERYFKYETLHVPLTLGSLVFDSTLTVLELKDSTATRALYYMEKYAANVGVIYKIKQDIAFVNSGKDTSGTIYRETLVEYIK